MEVTDKPYIYRIRNRDSGKFSKDEYEGENALLFKYFGTIEKATSLDVPLFDLKNEYIGNLDYKDDIL